MSELEQWRIIWSKHPCHYRLKPWRNWPLETLETVKEVDEVPVGQISDRKLDWGPDDLHKSAASGDSNKPRAQGEKHRSVTKEKSKKITDHRADSPSKIAPTLGSEKETLELKHLRRCAIRRSNKKFTKKQIPEPTEGSFQGLTTVKANSEEDLRKCKKKSKPQRKTVKSEPKIRKRLESGDKPDAEMTEISFKGADSFLCSDPKLSMDKANLELNLDRTETLLDLKAGTAKETAIILRKPTQKMNSTKHGPHLKPKHKFTEGRTQMSHDDDHYEDVRSTSSEEMDECSEAFDVISC